MCIRDRVIAERPNHVRAAKGVLRHGPAACTIVWTLCPAAHRTRLRPSEGGTPMRRREILALLSGAALSWPAAARSQQGMPVIAFLHSGLPQVNSGIVEAFRQGLREAGFTENRNLKIEFRWAEDHNDRLPALAADLVRLEVAVIAANSVAAVAAKAATATIPIVFQSGIDPVVAGFVASLGHPGGNTTGVSFFASTLEVKKLELLHEIVPPAAVIAVLVNPNNPLSLIHI